MFDYAFLMATCENLKKNHQIKKKKENIFETKVLKIEGLNSNQFSALKIQSFWHRNELSKAFRFWFIVRYRNPDSQTYEQKMLIVIFFMF